MLIWGHPMGSMAPNVVLGVTLWYPGHPVGFGGTPWGCGAPSWDPGHPMGCWGGGEGTQWAFGGPPHGDLGVTLWDSGHPVGF